MAVIARASRWARAATGAFAASAVLASGCDPTCWDECTIGEARCDGNEVQYCAVDPYRDDCDVLPNVWKTLETCGSAEACTTQGCDRRDACCAAIGVTRQSR